MFSAQEMFVKLQVLGEIARVEASVITLANKEKILKALWELYEAPISDPVRTSS